jgi:F420-dependent oxidoreductase-like protein
MTHPLRFGLKLSGQDTTIEALRAVWRIADESGFDHVWDFDHLASIGDAGPDRPIYEGWTLQAAIAEATKRVRIGCLVTGNTYRNPALLAKMVTTVDQISNGRVYLGIGAAWFEPEHQAYGFPFYTAKERADRLGEALEVITKLWTTDHPSFAGKYYLLDKAPFNPRPVQKPHPPIVIGGKGKKWIMPLVAKYADGWNVPIGVSPAGIKKRMEIVRNECQRIGRTPCDPEVSAFLVLYSISDIPLAGPVLKLGARAIAGKNVSRSVLAGSPKEITDQIRQYVDAGASHIIVHIEPPYDPELLRRFAKEVMPNFR